MNYDSNLVRFLIILPIVLATLIAVTLVRRRLLKEVPFFSAYIFGQVIMTSALYLIYNSGNQLAYFYGTWVQTGICVTLAFLVIPEVFRKTLDDYKSVRRASVQYLIFVGLLLTVISILILPYGTRPNLFIDTFSHTVLAAERSVRILQIGTVVAFFAFSSYLALSWKHYLFGIVLGYGLYATANLSCKAYVAYMGPSVSYMTSLVESAAYSCALLVWLIYLLKPDPPHRGLPPSATAKDDLEQWSDALAKLK
jgi:hypothetical protein